MANRRRYSDKMIITALRDARGLVAPAAKALGCHEATIRNRVREVPAVREALQEARAALVDLAEQRLYEAVDAGESWAVALVVRTLGRDRGYGDQVALTGAGGGPLAMAHSLDDPQARLRERLQAVHERLTAAHQIEQAG
jgi:hypothetical protein